MREGFTGRRIVAVAPVVLPGPLAAGGQGAWEAPASDKTRKNPVAPGATAVTQGKQVAQLNCVACHGTGGKGDGAVGQTLSPRPADWTSPVVQSESDGELFWK